MNQTAGLSFVLCCFFGTGKLAAEEQRVVRQPEAESVLSLTSPDDILVMEVTVGGKLLKVAVGMEEPVSWLRPGAVEAPVIDDPAAKAQWIMAPLKLGSAEIVNEAFLVNDSRQIVLPEACQGVIGHSTLREFCLSFNFFEKKLTLYPPKQMPVLSKEEAFALALDERPVAVAGTGIHVKGGRMMLPVQIENGVYVPFVAATLQRKPPRSVPRALLEKKLPGFATTGDGPLIKFPKLSLGALKFKDGRLALTGADAPQDAGLLNISGFRLDSNLFIFNCGALLGGIRYVAGENYSLQMFHLGMEVKGKGNDLVVARVDAGSPAAKAGILVGDVIQKYLGTELRLPLPPAAQAALDREDDPVTMTWQRGVEAPVTSTIVRRPPLPTDPLMAGYYRRSSIPDGNEGISLPLERTFMGHMVTMRINGRDIRAVLDTGANGTLVSPGQAEALGIRSGSVVDLTGIAGVTQQSRVGVASRLEIAGAVIQDEPVVIAALPEPFEAILGMSTLRDFDMRIDPRAKRLTLWPAGKAPLLPGETALPLTVETKNPASGVANPQRWQLTSLQTAVTMAGHHQNCKVDTGSGGLFLLPSGLAEKLMPGVTANAPPARVSSVGMSGAFASRSIRIPSFQFGPDTLTNLVADAVDFPDRSTLGGYGILGNGILQHYVMTFDFKAGSLRLLPLGTVQDVTRKSTAGVSMGFKDGEVVILSLEPGGAGELAGLLAGDTVIEIGGIPIKELQPEQMAAFQRLPPGTATEMTYRRASGKPVRVSVILQKE